MSYFYPVNWGNSCFVVARFWMYQFIMKIYLLPKYSICAHWTKGGHFDTVTQCKNTQPQPSVLCSINLYILPINVVTIQLHYMNTQWNTKLLLEIISYLKFLPKIVTYLGYLQIIQNQHLWIQYSHISFLNFV